MVLGVCLGCMWFRLFFSDFCFLWFLVGFLCVVLSDFLGVFKALDCEDFGDLEVMFGGLRFVGWLFRFALCYVGFVGQIRV